MNILDIFALAERGGIYTTAFITIVVVQAIKQTKLNNQYMPLWSLLIGVVSGIFVGIAYHSDILIGAIDGFIAGAIASGLFDAIKTTWQSLFKSKEAVK